MAVRFKRMRHQKAHVSTQTLELTSEKNVRLTVSPKFHTEDRCEDIVKSTIGKAQWQPYSIGSCFSVGDVVKVAQRTLTFDQDDVFPISLPVYAVGHVSRIEDGDSHVYFPQLQDRVYPWRWISSKSIANLCKNIPTSS